MKYINLTGGLEWLPEITPDGFVRIESTLCEQKHWGLLLQRLDANFLVRIASGIDIEVYDTTSRYSDVSRALWQGLPLINYCLYRAWLGEGVTTFFKTQDTTKYCNRVWAELPRSSKNKLKYFGRFCNGNIGKIIPVCKKSIHDGQEGWWKEILPPLDSQFLAC
jgi:hypothetical protein